MNVIVIGGGASGLMAAITAAKSAYDALSDEDIASRCWSGKPVLAASCSPLAMAAATSPT